MKLQEFVAGMALEGGALRLPAPAFDAYFSRIFPEALRADPPRYAFAATAHAALMSLTRHLVLEGVVLHAPAPGSEALAAARRGTRDTLLHLAPGEPAPEGRLLRALLAEQAAPLADPAWPPLDRPPPTDPHGVVLVALLRGDEAVPASWSEAQRHDFPGFALLVRA